MTAEILFDTNAAIAWIEDSPTLYSALESDLGPVVSLITIGELEFGAAKSARAEQNRDRLARALFQFRRLSIDDATPRFYGDLQAALRRKGKPIPVNDVWIAAIALQHKLPLLTRDAHFREVDGLVLKTW